MRSKIVQTTAKNATLIRKGFKESFNADAIVAAWFESHPNPESMTVQGARDWGLAHIHAKRKPLQNALARTYANGYTIGNQIARSRLLSMVTKSVMVQTVDWTTWTPGMSSAAALVKPKAGLRNLLDRESITISDDIIHTKIDRIGTALYTGLSNGYGPREIAQMIDAIIDDPQHALMIARTETSRALSVANRDEYEKNNVEMVEWLVSDPCDICQENGDAGPIGINEEFPSGDTEPPAHPNCECALAPYFDDSTLPEVPESELEEY